LPAATPQAGLGELPDRALPSASQETPAPGRSEAPPPGREPRRNKVWIRAAVVLAVILAGLGWLLVSILTPTRIADVKAECGQHEKPVTLSVQVVKTVSVPFTDIGAYKVSDGLDDLWVVSMQPAPSEGAAVRVSGLAYDVDEIAWDCESTGLSPRWCKVLSTAIRFIAGSCVLVEEEWE
jgi:hypothetical protein